MARLSLANMMVDLPTEIALTPGSTIQLAVAGTPGNLKLALVQQGDGAAKGQGVQAPVQPGGVTPPASTTSGSVRPSRLLRCRRRCEPPQRDRTAWRRCLPIWRLPQEPTLPQPVHQAVARLLTLQTPTTASRGPT